MGAELRKEFVNKMMLEMVPSTRYVYSCVDAQNYVKKIDIELEEWQEWVIANPPSTIIYRELRPKDLTNAIKRAILKLKGKLNAKKRIWNTIRTTSRK